MCYENWTAIVEDPTNGTLVVYDYDDPMDRIEAWDAQEGAELLAALYWVAGIEVVW